MKIGVYSMLTCEFLIPLSYISLPTLLHRFVDRDMIMRFRGGGIGHQATRHADHQLNEAEESDISMSGEDDEALDGLATGANRTQYGEDEEDWDDDDDDDDDDDVDANADGTHRETDDADNADAEEADLGPEGIDEEYGTDDDDLYDTF
jgi:hypothetical protein